jgi:hypothetical protein
LNNYDIDYYNAVNLWFSSSLATLGLTSLHALKSNFNISLNPQVQLIAVYIDISYFIRVCVFIYTGNLREYNSSCDLKLATAIGKKC